MTYRGMVKPEHIHEIEQIFHDREYFENAIEFIEATDPEVYENIQKNIAKTISDISTTSKISMADSQKFAVGMMSSFLYGYIIHRVALGKTIDQMLDMNNMKYDADKNIDRWLNGLMGSKYYDYPLTGLSKTSPKYIAKKAYLNRIKQTEATMDFYDIHGKTKSYLLDEDISLI